MNEAGITALYPGVGASVSRESYASRESTLAAPAHEALGGWKFYRQYPLYRYIADFYCEKARLVVELDGGAHDRKRQMEYDGERDRYLSVCGIRTLRFSNERALQATGDVLAEIRRQCEMAQIVKLTSDTATQKM